MMSTIPLKMSIDLNRLLHYSSATALSLEIYGANLLGEDVFLPAQIGTPLAMLNTLHAKSGRYLSVTLRGRW